MSDYSAVTDILERELVALESKQKLVAALKALGQLENATDLAVSQRDAAQADAAKAALDLATAQQATADAVKTHDETVRELEQDHQHWIEHFNTQREKIQAEAEAETAKKAEQAKADLETHLAETRKELAEALSHFAGVQDEIAAHEVARESAAKATAEAEAALKAVQDQIHALASVHAN